MLLLIYFLLGFIFPTALGDCPPGTIQSSLNGECYQLFYQPSTWSQAESTCVGNGGHLASIRNLCQLGNCVGYCASQLINNGARLSKAVKQGGLWASYLCGEQKPYICEYNSQNNNSPTPVTSTCPPPVTTTCPPPVTSTCPTPETFTCPTCPTCPTPAISTCPACPTPQVITCPPPVTSTCSTPETFTCPTCPTCPTPAIITCPACPTPQVITCPTPVTNYATCPDGWFYMSPSQNCYKAESLYLTWSSALNHCRTKYNATLPSIHSDVENYLLNNILHLHVHVIWIPIFGPVYLNRIAEIING
uniref:Uncharacterized protein n=1 Tax=Acrobeloides nanus TaxID=290746 RepID=A0A914E483_9BILA